MHKTFKKVFFSLDSQFMTMLKNCAGYVLKLWGPKTISLENLKKPSNTGQKALTSLANRLVKSVFTLKGLSGWSSSLISEA